MNKQNSPIVLVADDEDRFRTALVDALRFFGHEVFEAKTGQELENKGLLIIKKQIPYALIVDNQMPEKEGEPEQQWCGLNHILKLCEAEPGYNLEKHVLFLSRWGLPDLSEDLKKEANKYRLLQEDQWWYVYTSYAILKGHIERILKIRE